MKTLGWILCCTFVCWLCVLPVTTDEVEPRYPKKVERPRPPVGPDGEPLVTVGGRWYSNFGYMVLEQDHWTFKGTYSCCEGQIHGEILANQVEYLWEDPIYGKGWGYFKLPDEGQRLAGVWGGEHDMGSSGGWNAVLLEERSYDGEPSRWGFAAEHPQIGTVRGEAVLYFSQDRIAGELVGAAETRTEAYPEGKSYRHEVFRYLEGRAEGDEVHLEWHNPLTQRTGMLSLTRTSGQLEGVWNISDEIAEPILFQRIAETSSVGSR